MPKAQRTRSDFEKEAQRAAHDCDPIAMLTALWGSGFLDKLDAFVRYNFGEIEPDDANWVIAQAVDSLYDKLRRGERKRDIFQYLFASTRNIAKDLRHELSRRVGFDEHLDTEIQAQELLSDEEREEAAEAAQERRQQVLAELKRLIRRIPQARPRQVLGIIVDALEKNVFDLTHEEIGKKLGIAPNTVVQAKKRGIDRLKDMIEEEGLMPFGASLFDDIEKDSTEIID